MEKDEIVLRKSRRQLFINAVVSGFATVFCIIVASMDWKYDIGMWGAILVAILTFAGCVYQIKEWRDRKIEIVMTTAGIKLRDEGFYAWSAIEKISTHVDEGDVTLILHVRNKAAIRFGITSLEITDEELIELILDYGKTAGLYYSK